MSNSRPTPTASLLLSHITNTGFLSRAPGGAGPPDPPPPTAVPVPTNAAAGSNKNCQLWHNVISGDNCAQISADANTPLADFYFLNPSLDGTCHGLWLNTSYCVQPVGDISSYPGYNVTGPSTTFTRPPPATTRASWALPTTSQFPRASGTAEDCVDYQNYRSTGIMSKLGAGFNVVDLNSCVSVASKWNIGVTNLLQWNPSLQEGNCVLQMGLSYCVGKKQTSGESEFPWILKKAEKVRTCSHFTIRTLTSWIMANVIHSVRIKQPPAQTPLWTLPSHLIPLDLQILLFPRSILFLPATLLDQLKAALPLQHQPLFQHLRSLG